MKKVIAVLLSVIMVFGGLSVMVCAADNYTKAYYVTAPEENAKKYAIVPYGTDSAYVKEGESFRFTIQELGSYTMNDTCVVKVASTDFAVQNISDPDLVPGTVLYPEIVKVTETVDGVETEVEYEVYTISAVEEDMYVYVCNIANKSMSGILDFLNGLFNFFVTFIKWFFGLR